MSSLRDVVLVLNMTSEVLFKLPSITLNQLIKTCLFLAEVLERLPREPAASLAASWPNEFEDHLSHCMQSHAIASPLPRVTFVEVSAMVNRAAQQVVIGWSESSLAQLSLFGELEVPAVDLR